MSKVLSGGIIIFFVAGLTLAGFLALNENPDLIQGTKPDYHIIKAEIKEERGIYEQFILSIGIDNGSLSIIGVNHNFFKWELNGEFNQTKTDKIDFTITYVGLGSRIKTTDNVDSYFVQIFLSDGNILTWKFNQEIQMDFIP